MSRLLRAFSLPARALLLAFLLGTAGHAVKVYESASSFLEKLDGLQPAASSATCACPASTAWSCSGA